MATLDDVPLLARMNRELIEDEGHRNRSRADCWLEERMRRFLSGGYQATLFIEGEKVVGYALFIQHPEHEDTVHLRQIFIVRDSRGRGLGREALRILSEVIWPPERRITVDVLVGNSAARALYESVGFHPYALELEIPASDRRAASPEC
jgi:ribosomal protein S18 acetylase RimI-like enzyme